MTIELKIRPDRGVFEALAREWPLVPVWAELLADVSTPVGLFPAIAGDGPGVLLESVERSERWGRYSFVAGDPASTIVVDADGLHLLDVVRDLPIDVPAGVGPREALIAAGPARRGARRPPLPPRARGGVRGAGRGCPISRL